MYESIVKPILFKFDPEFVHDTTIAAGELFGKFSVARRLLSGFFSYSNPALTQEVCGIRFENPVGLAAGFDKDVRLTKIIPSVGFGFMEVGAVTALPCAGNPGKHLVRLPADQSIIVYYGLKNIGAQAVARKIEREKLLPWRIPTGINIAKTNHPSVKGEKSVDDYVQTYRLLGDRFSYVTINISCPNAQDGCTFQDPTMLRDLLAALAGEKKPRPVFLKISNHLSLKEVDEILAVIADIPLVDGLIISNLSKNRDMLTLHSEKSLLEKLPHGGISGAPISAQANTLISHVYRQTGKKYPIIGLGGIFTAEDAYQKIKSGATLIQIITGLIYGGPGTVARINRGLVELLKKDGLSHISQAIGVAVKA